MLLTWTWGNSCHLGARRSESLLNINYLLIKSVFTILSESLRKFKRKLDATSSPDEVLVWKNVPLVWLIIIKYLFKVMVLNDVSSGQIKEIESTSSGDQSMWLRRGHGCLTNESRTSAFKGKIKDLLCYRVIRLFCSARATWQEKRKSSWKKQKTRVKMDATLGLIWETKDRWIWRVGPMPTHLIWLPAQDCV